MDIKYEVIIVNFGIGSQTPCFSLDSSSVYIYFTGSTVAVVIAAAVLSFCGAVSANFVTYMDL